MKQVNLLKKVLKIQQIGIVRNLHTLTGSDSAKKSGVKVQIPQIPVPALLIYTDNICELSSFSASFAELTQSGCFLRKKHPGFPFPLRDKATRVCPGQNKYNTDMDIKRKKYPFRGDRIHYVVLFVCAKLTTTYDEFRVILSRFFQLTANSMCHTAVCCKWITGKQPYALFIYFSHNEILCIYYTLNTLHMYWTETEYTFCKKYSVSTITLHSTNNKAIIYNSKTEKCYLSNTILLFVFPERGIFSFRKNIPPPFFTAIYHQWLDRFQLSISATGDRLTIQQFFAYLYIFSCHTLSVGGILFPSFSAPLFPRTGIDTLPNKEWNVKQ
jgi:hypothetical protein